MSFFFSSSVKACITSVPPAAIPPVPMHTFIFISFAIISFSVAVLILSVSSVKKTCRGLFY